ncbi:glycosyl hydrolase [Cohnella nanjingensis]|uniref:Beta-mannanase n=1 Tax=Cohnella nanjingensis TaxID=1387779 RepID=A0A7X0RWV3_9BACL|nr:glycosyl hydrolase [Cohnella nanjingensis]MBB6673579.1 hypothetical protein [Cohnella nanjingensis]
MRRPNGILILASVLILAAIGGALAYRTYAGDKTVRPTFYEAEAAEMSGTEPASSGSGYSGTGYVTGFDQDGDSLTFRVSAPKAGLYQIALGYRAPNGDKTLSLQLNEQPAGDIPLKASNAFGEAPAGKVLLLKGENRLTILKNWGWYDIDYLKVQPAAKAKARKLNRALVNPNASAEATALYRYLREQDGDRILSGQQGYDNVSWILDKTGKKPAVVGFDLIDYSPTRVAHGAKSSEIENAIAWHEQGGIVTFAWHWNAPKDLIDESGKEWWRGFYADATTFDVAYAMDHPDSEDYKLLLSDIDAIAAQLQKLQEAKVPVLFRPLHEAEGGWFWWGAKGPEPAKKLYRLVYDRLTNAHHLNNLIWIWNSIDPDWYPGDDAVDIVSCDSYPPDGDYGPVIASYDRLNALGGGRKLVALTENGPIPDPDLLDAYGAGWSWFCTWEGDFLTDGKKNSLEHLVEVYNHKRVVTLGELPDWKTYGR